MPCCNTLRGRARSKQSSYKRQSKKDSGSYTLLSNRYNTPTRSAGAPSPSNENSNTDCAGKLVALVWAPGKVMLGTEPFCDSADASADIADVAEKVFDESAGTGNAGAYTKHFCDELSRFVVWDSCALQFTGSVFSSFAFAAACVVFFGDGLDCDF
jgi:hypothetical protein